MAQNASGAFNVPHYKSTVIKRNRNAIKLILNSAMILPS